MTLRWVGLVGIVVSAAWAQEPAPQAVFRTGVKLVQVSVIAQDKKGLPVPDLRREEFQVFDNGAPQEIRLFIAEKPAAAAAREARAPNTFTNRIGVDDDAAAAGSRGGCVARHERGRIRDDGAGSDVRVNDGQTHLASATTRDRDAGSSHAPSPREVVAM